jgi:hypothetical protein
VYACNALITPILRRNAQWVPAYFGASASYPDVAPDDPDGTKAKKCFWKDATKSNPPFKMCTFDPEVDKQISAYIHKEGFWNAAKQELFERVLPPIGTPDMAMPERTLVIDVSPLEQVAAQIYKYIALAQIGANLGFFTLLPAMRRYDVISIEPSKEVCLRLLYSLKANGISIGSKGSEDVATGSGVNRQPVVHVFQEGCHCQLAVALRNICFNLQNGAGDSYNSMVLRFVPDNPGASWLEIEGRGVPVSCSAYVTMCISMLIIVCSDYYCTHG